MENEHSSYTTKGGTSGGSVAADFVHKAGSAKAYYDTSEPTVRPDGSTSLGTGDDGRIWVDSDDKVPYVWTGTAWVVLDTVAGIAGKAIAPASVASVGAVSGTTITGTTITGTGNVTGAGFTTGDVVVKFKKYTGTYSAYPTAVAHGLTASKILHVSIVFVHPSISGYISPQAQANTLYGANVSWDTTNIYLWHVITGVAYKMLVTYEA